MRPFLRPAAGACAALLLGAAPLSAQRAQSIQCSLNNFADGWVESCSSDAECSRKYNDHLCTEHNLCGGAGGAVAERPPDPRKAPILMGLGGLLLGGTLGLAAEHGKTEEEKQADVDAGKAPPAVVGAAVGAAIGVTMGLMVKAIQTYQHPVIPSWAGRVRSDVDIFTGRTTLYLQW